MNLIRLADKLNIVVELVNVAAYDFDFELFFDCRHPIYWEGDSVCVLRTGAIPDYPGTLSDYAERGLTPINTGQQHLMASELSAWYPLIQDLTPHSAWFSKFPEVEEIEDTFGWPIFVKGTRQTSRHNPDLCIARDAEAYRKLIPLYADDPILHWQDIAIRELVTLKPLSGKVSGKISPSVEFRTFWWFGVCVGYGPYWYQLPSYSEPDINVGLSLAETAAKRLDVPFLVVDIAKKVDGTWTIIECNDAQESGYAGVMPQILWSNILKLC